MYCKKHFPLIGLLAILTSNGNRVFHHDEDYETTWIYTMHFDRPVADLLELE